jgi:hypothetical protein
VNRRSFLLTSCVAIGLTSASGGRAFGRGGSDDDRDDDRDDKRDDDRDDRRDDDRDDKRDDDKRDDDKRDDRSGKDRRKGKGKGGDREALRIGPAEVRKLGQDGIRIRLPDGGQEQVVGNRYRRLDRNGRVIEQRSARQADVDRLTGLARRSGATRGVVIVNSANGTVRVTDREGWTETIRNNRYSLTDPRGNLVTRRAVWAKDLERLRAAIGR